MTERRPIAARDTRWASRIAKFLADHGVSPNAISAASVAFGVAAGAALAADPGLLGFAAAGLLIQGRLLCNLFDGMVAVEGNRASATGELWNDLPDRLSDTAIFVGAGYGAGIPWLGWLVAVIALHVAYARVLGRAVGARTHFVGPMAKQHRMATLTAACAVALVAQAALGGGPRPEVLQIALAAVAVGGVVTFVRRLALAAADLRAAHPAPSAPSAASGPGAA